jgi:hypothetical protein
MAWMPVAWIVSLVTFYKSISSNSPYQSKSGQVKTSPTGRLNEADLSIVHN